MTGIVRCDRFEQLPNRMRHFSNTVSAHKAVSHGAPAPLPNITQKVR